MTKSSPESPAKEQPEEGNSEREIAVRHAQWDSLNAAIRGYMESYEYGEDGYEPDENEKAMCEDFVQGLLAEDTFIQAIAQIYPIRKRFVPAKEQPGEQNAAPDNTARNAALVADLRAIRQRAIDKGMKLLSLEEINQLLDREPPPPERP